MTNYNKSDKNLKVLKINRENLLKFKVICAFCNKKFSKSNIKKHIDSCFENSKNFKECPVCSRTFLSKSTTCSHGCANTYFRKGVNHPNTKETSYRTICFSYHKKECIICGEKNIVGVHHLDGNKNNNKPENLIPMCPTHHQYWHSRHKQLIEEKVNTYIKNWKIVRNLGD